MTVRTEISREGLAVVGELVIMATSLDFQLNKVIIAVLDLGERTMIEPVIATLDTSRKIEILKTRAALMPKTDWRMHLIKYVEAVEDVVRQRNIVCHTAPVLEESGWTFQPIAAAKLFRKIDLVDKSVKSSSILDCQKAIETGGRALSQGITLVLNFNRAKLEGQRPGNPNE